MALAAGRSGAAVLSCHRPEGQVCSLALAGLMAGCQQDSRERFSPPALEVWQSLRQLVACPSKLASAVGCAGCPAGGGGRGELGDEATMQGQRRCRRKAHSRASFARVLGWGHGPLGPVITEVAAGPMMQRGSAAGSLGGVGNGNGGPPINHLCGTASAFDPQGSHGHVWKLHARLN